MNTRADDATKAKLLAWVRDSEAHPAGQPSTPPQSVDDSTALQAAFFQILQNRALTHPERLQQMAAATLAALHARGRFYHHRERRDFASAMFFDAHRKLLVNLAADEFLAWLSGWTGLNRVERAFQFILAAIQNEALAGKTTAIEPAAFWSATPGAVYLSNGDGHLARITPGAVEIADNGTDGILFAAGQTLRPWTLTTPRDPFTACRLFAGAKYAAPHGFDLLRLWALSLPTGQRCKPPCVASGAIGSGKTRAAVGIFELLGIPPRVTAIHEDGEGDFWTALDAGGLVCFDNADTRTRWLADALAAAATNGAHEKRQLYTDGRIIRQQARAWVILTSANPTFAADAGLADRLLVVRLERRTEDTAESALSDEIAANRDAGLSWMAHTIGAALADTGPTPANLNRRHPDFAAFAVRLGRAIGRERETVAALQAAEGDKSLFNLQNDEIGAAILDHFTEGRTFTGTAKELLDALKEADPTLDGKWNGARLGKRIGKLWPHLQSVLSAHSEIGRGRVVRYSFGSSGEDGEDQGGVSRKVPMLSSRGSFQEMTLQSSPSSPLEPVEVAP